MQRSQEIKTQDVGKGSRDDKIVCQITLLCILPFYGKCFEDKEYLSYIFLYW